MWTTAAARERKNEQPTLEWKAEKERGNTAAASSAQRNTKHVLAWTRNNCFVRDVVVVVDVVFAVRCCISFVSLLRQSWAMWGWECIKCVGLCVFLVFIFINIFHFEFARVQRRHRARRAIVDISILSLVLEQTEFWDFVFSFFFLSLCLLSLHRK